MKKYILEMKLGLEMAERQWKPSEIVKWEGDTGHGFKIPVE